MHRVPYLLLFLLLSHSFVSGQTQTVSGRVTSAEETAGLPGVNVFIKGTSSGSITDAEGKFTISADQGAILVFSFVGHKSQEFVYRGQTNINILLEEDLKELNEVVVTGYSSVEKRDITGSVTSIKADDFKEISLNGIDQALQGQAPGVQVTQSSGTPGGGISVRIRGSTSISASNRPLFVIDGIPVESGSLSLRDFGGQDDNALSLVNPGDIESIQILKDASAKAMYGSRAANGVVIIATKRGKQAQTRITFDMQRGIVDPVKKLQMLNATQLLTLQRETVTNAGQDPDALGLIPGVTDAVNTDWLDEIFRTGIMQQYQLSASGGDDNTKYYFSGSYRKEEGVQLNNSFERFGGTMNIDQKFNSKLTVKTSMSLSRALNKRVKGDNFLDGVYSGAIKSLPFYTPYDENGDLVGPGSPLYAAFPNFNPVAQAVLPRFDAYSVKLLGSISAVYQFNDNLIWTTKAGIDYNNVIEDQFESSQTAIGGYLSGVGGQGYGVYSASTITNFTANTVLSYSKELNSDHRINALIGSELLQRPERTGSVQGRLFPSDDFTYITSAGIVDAGSSYRVTSALLSFFSEVKYDYKDRYLVTGTFRADGSSRFGSGNRFGYFPALSAAWRISDEGFFHSSIINDLKLRTSYGLTGNERIGDFQFLGTWAASTYSGSTGVGPNGLSNPNLKWETTREINIGTDVSLYNGRVQVSVDVYNNKTTGLLYRQPYASTTGFTNVLSNIGDLSNKGIELGIATINVDNIIKWTTDINLSKNVNKILFLNDTIPQYAGYSAEGVSATNVIQEGQPLGTFIGLDFLGVDPATGDAMYRDVNKDGIINNDDAIVIGNAQPKLFGGITNKVVYRNFDLSIFFQFSYGNKVLNFTKATTVNAGTDLASNQSVDALRRWQKEGDVTDIPRYELGAKNNFNNYHSNRLLEDGSYLRLKNLGFGYTFPQKITSRLKLERLRVYASATNLWTYTKYTGADPEVSTLDGSTTAQAIDFFTLPQVRTMSLGLNVTFK